MSNTVLRSTTFQLEFDGQAGITGVKTFTKAVSDADAVAAKLNDQLGGVAKATYKVVETEKEYVRQARAIVTETERTARNTERLTAHYKNLSDMVDKTAEEMEQLRAVQSLGANATEAQRQQVLAAVQEYQRLTAAQGGQQGSLRDARGIMQNFGWQMQDTIVQLQMGTSAFTVLSQQGSQMAAAFGPTGAILGAFIALAGVVGGSVYTALTGATDETKKLKEINEELGKYLSINADGATELSSAMEQLARYSKIAADEQLRLTRGEASKAQLESAKLIKKEIKELDLAARALNILMDESSYNFFARLETMRTGDFLKLQKELIDNVTVENMERYLTALNDMRGLNEDNAKKVEQVKKALIEQIKTMSESEQLLKDTEKGWENLSKPAVDAIDKITKAFNSEYNSLVKQTETVQQEYDRRKKIIDDFAAKNEDADGRIKQSYEALNLWRANELDKEFQRFYSNIVKKTNTTDEEYARQKAIIDDHVQRVGSVDDQAAEAYAALERWKTSEFTKEYDKREAVRRQIEKAQNKALVGDNGQAAENELYINNLKTLNSQLAELGENQLAERQRINALIEQEHQRHTTVMSELELSSYQTHVATFGMAAQQLTSLADIMATGANDVQERVKEMNDFQKTMFIVSQAVAAATALMNGISLGMKLAEMFPLVAPQMITLGTGIGAASAGAIMGVTLAGAFDKGGYIPQGQAGIVAEYGDELVNGVLVEGPARVTSREETARRMNSGGGETNISMKVSVENRIANAQYKVEQISRDEVKVIAEQVFSRNIDEGVSNVLGNNNSKSAKSMRKNYSTERRL